MKKVLLLLTFAFFITGIFPININGEYSDFVLDPQKPEVSVRRGESVNGHFSIKNTGNQTLEGMLVVNQFECAYHCPTIQILSDHYISLQHNESTRIDFRINSKWYNDVQKLIFDINVVNVKLEDSFRMEIVVNVTHNYLHYSLCLLITVFFIIILIVFIIKIIGRKYK